MCSPTRRDWADRSCPQIGGLSRCRILATRAVSGLDFDLGPLRMHSPAGNNEICNKGTNKGEDQR
jgi:hypothetical protein